VSARPGLHVFVLIDALGWRYVERLGFLADVLPYRMPLRTVLGYSSGAIPTILTGKTPAEHGHWNLFYYDPVGSPFRWLRPFRVLPERALNHRVTRKAIKEFGRRGLGLGPLFECCVSPAILPWFNWVEKANIYAPGGITGAPSIFDQLARASVPYRVYTYHRWTDATMLRQASRDIETGAASFLFLYLSEVDRFLHQHCQDAALVTKRVGWYEGRLRELVETARRHDPAAGFTVLSDHGMTPVHHHFDLPGLVSRLNLDMPNDYLSVYDSTMARFWFFSDRARRAIVERLAGLACGGILTGDELDQLGIRFADRRYGELVFLMDPGWLISGSDFNGSGWKPAGMHGYHPDDPDSDAIFLSNHEPSVSMRTIADAHTCMAVAADISDTRAGARVVPGLHQ
jgi:predicted AlkP superfamily pyrophosphatase or phosphodiesterase